jgi:hypothetical protein
MDGMAVGSPPAKLTAAAFLPLSKTAPALKLLPWRPSAGVETNMELLFAYFDPGSGSLLVQALVGGAAGLVVFARYWWDRAALIRQGPGAANESNAKA